MSLPKKKSLFLTIILWMIPFYPSFFYLGGWRVYLPIFLTGGVIPILLMPVNLDLAALPLNLKVPIMALMSIVYLYHTLLFRLEYNWVTAKGENERNWLHKWYSLMDRMEGMPEEHEKERMKILLDDPEMVRSFKRGWCLVISISKGIILVYGGVLLFWADLSRSGDVTFWTILKATLITGGFLFLLNKALGWINRTLKRAILTPEEGTAYFLIRFHSGAIKYHSIKGFAPWN